MINFISVTGDWNYNLYLIFGNLALLLLIISSEFLIITLLVIKSKGKISIGSFVESKHSLVFVFFITAMLATLVMSFSFSVKSIGADKWVLLAQAESTILQLQVSSEMQKKPLPFDRQKSEDWIKDLRDKSSSGSINYREFQNLVEDYNSLNIGSDDIKNWFKTNSPDSIKKELENNVNSAISNAQQPTPQEPTVQSTETNDIEQRLNSALN